CPRCRRRRRLLRRRRGTGTPAHGNVHPSRGRFARPLLQRIAQQRVFPGAEGVVKRRPGSAGGKTPRGGLHPGGGAASADADLCAHVSLPAQALRREGGRPHHRRRPRRKRPPDVAGRVPGRHRPGQLAGSAHFSADRPGRGHRRRGHVPHLQHGDRHGPLPAGGPGGGGQSPGRVAGGAGLDHRPGDGRKPRGRLDRKGGPSMSIAVFASGSGSNFQALVEASRAEDWPEPIRLLVCDRPGARVLERAEKLGVPSLLVDPKEFSSKADYEAEILARLRREGIRRLVLAGYMRLIGPTLLDAYRWRIVNIHPSLLPAFPGKDAVGQALDYGVKWTGVTVHFVDEGMDTGPIIAQEPVRVDEGDDRASLTRKIQAVEHRLYPAVILDWISGRIKEPAG